MDIYIEREMCIYTYIWNFEKAVETDLINIKIKQRINNGQTSISSKI